MSTYSLEIYSVDFNIFLRNSRHTGFRLVETKDDGSISIKIMEISQDDGVTTGKAYTTVGHVYNIDGKDFIWDKKGGGKFI